MMSNLKKSLFWQEHDAELRHLAEVEHLTSKQIADKFGVSRDAVTGRANRIGVKWHNKPLFWKLKQQKKFQKTVQERKDVAKILEPSKDYWANRYGWSFPNYGYCVFPEGDLRKSNLSFCGEPVIQDGKPYCPDHHMKAYYRTSRGV